MWIQSLVLISFGLAAGTLLSERVIPCTGEGQGLMCVPGMGNDVWVLPTDAESNALARSRRGKRQTETLATIGTAIKLAKELKELIQYTYEDTIVEIIKDPTINEIAFANFNAKKYFRAYGIKLDRIDSSTRGDKNNFLDHFERELSRPEFSWMNKAALISELSNCWFNLYGEGRDSDFKFEKGKPGYIRLYRFVCFQVEDRALFAVGAYNEDFTLDQIHNQVKHRECKSNWFKSSCKEYLVDQYFDRGLTLAQRLEFENYAKQKLAYAVADEYKSKLPPNLQLP